MLGCDAVLLANILQGFWGNFCPSFQGETHIYNTDGGCRSLKYMDMYQITYTEFRYVFLKLTYLCGILMAKIYVHAEGQF